MEIRVLRPGDDRLVAALHGADHDRLQHGLLERVAAADAGQHLVGLLHGQPEPPGYGGIDHGGAGAGIENKEKGLALDLDLDVQVAAANQV